MNREIRQENLAQTGGRMAEANLAWQVSITSSGSVLDFSPDNGLTSSQLKCQWAKKWAQWSRQKLALAQQPLAKAAALQKHQRRVIWDLTCGLGYDSLWFLFFGQQVVAFERHPGMFALVTANLHASALNPPPWLAQGGSFKLVEGDFQKMAQTTAVSASSTNSFEATLPHPDVLYLDPMFGDEGGKRKAPPKKNLQVLPQLVGLDEDAPQLLCSALTWAKAQQVGRVILKRPLHAPILREPDWQIKAKQIRFDGWTTGPKLT